jgi:hypothetical protein
LMMVTFSPPLFRVLSPVHWTDLRPSGESGAE